MRRLSPALLLLSLPLLPTLASPDGDIAAGVLETGTMAVASDISLSIRNEMDVAMAGGRDYLASRQGDDGLWDDGDGRTSLPAFAFLDAPEWGAEPTDAERRALAAALARLAAWVPHVQDGENRRRMAEDALVVAASCAMYGEKTALPLGTDSAILAAVRTRLTMGTPAKANGMVRGSAASLPSVTAWLGREAAMLLPGPELPPSPMQVDGIESIRDAAIAAMAILEKENASAPETARIAATLRWMRAHTAVLGGPDAIRTSTEDLFFLSAFLSATSQAAAAEAGIPADWRTRIAQRLIATAKPVPNGLRWDGDNRQTLFAVAALAAL